VKRPLPTFSEMNLRPVVRIPKARSELDHHQNSLAQTEIKHLVAEAIPQNHQKCSDHLETICKKKYQTFKE